MYKLIKQIDKVNDYKIIDNKLCLWQNDKIIYNDSLIYSGDIFGCDNYRQSFVIPINSGMSSVYINLNKKINKEFSYIKGVKAFINEEEILYNIYIRERRKRNISRINLLTEEKKWEIESYFGRGNIFDNYLYAEGKNNKFYKIDLDHPTQPLWQFDLSQLGEPKKNKYPYYLYGDEPYQVLKIIGILDAKLWVALNHYTLLALDINTGKLVYQLSNIENFNYPFGSIIPAPESMEIDTKRNVLYALAWEYYWEINPKTGEIQMWDLFDYFQSLKLRNDLIRNYVKTNDIIYFASRNDDCNYESQLAGFDINTKKIIWQHKFQPDENGKILQVNDVKGNEKMLAIKDMANNLYIFEKQNNEIL